VFRSHKPKIANFRSEYAKHADFCDVFDTQTKPLYLLACLLPASHKESEQCFVSTVEEAGTGGVQGGQVLISNGQQTLGVALPWAIAATLVRPSEKVLSISGDGGAAPVPSRTHDLDRREV
jgi:hypothetical protein